MTYSQLGQDAWVLTQLQGKRNGTFVDVGAHDGKHFSNTYLLEKEYGWTGVCVEANAGSFDALKANRSALCLPYAAWSKSGHTLNFHQHQLPMLSGINEAGSVTVETRSLNDILDEAGLVDVDYISLDTEGTEAEILSTFDWTKHKVTCWTIEHNGSNDAMNYFAKVFTEHGYLWRIWHWDVLAVKDAWQVSGGVEVGGVG